MKNCHCKKDFFASIKKYPFLIAAHDTCLTMSKVAANLTSKSATLPESTPARFPTDDLMFVKLEKILIECIDKKNDDQYIPMAQQVKKEHLFTIQAFLDLRC